MVAGDNPPHDVWMEDEASQVNATQRVRCARAMRVVHCWQVTKLIRAALPNIPLFPAMGNHEGFPASEYYRTHPARAA